MNAFRDHPKYATTEDGVRRMEERVRSVSTVFAEVAKAPR